MSDSQSPRVEACDLCIIGAGIAGLNALFAASRYLSRYQKVILIDRRPRPGGMWVDVYSYVRLHQPHPMFTAGNIEWTLDRDRAPLATKREVLDHLRYCVDVIAERVPVDEYFGWEFESQEEANGVVRATCRAADGRMLVVEAKRLIKAFGLAVTPNQPLDISSRRVHSVSPDYCDIRAGDIRESRAPVWIIGGGKTAMDTAHALITAYPGREVNLVAGRGTFFSSRDRLLPSGSRRWWTGTVPSTVAAQLSRRFDGTNESEVQDWYRATYGTFLTPQSDNFVLGVLSEAENDTISAGLNDVVMDYLEDVVDCNGTTELLLRSGSTKAIEPGSWVVNCTGYLNAADEYPYEPYVSPSGAIVSINVRSAVLHLPAFMGYFLGHLLFLDKLREIPLYELDWQGLRDTAPIAFPYVLFAHVQHNLSLIYENVPRAVFRENGLDFDKWYPLPRRLPGLTRFVLTHRRERERQRRVLNTVRERFDIRCGPINEQRVTRAKMYR
ncbi:MAG: FAD-dependent oxidoreductase [Actinomycetota bacterium]|uniref:FAD-dependent oxidoreductase n=1 Tax=Mycobacterium lentiflavum TaxID=141349 RepID=A0ABY3URA6_MYCLN|nr:FAD-dependent oxidoreductase [Mycobacterium lentiflavum]MEE3064643.1 FAD-dependent oxidoreductase [Actinomycetota bacterium]ULP40982.1 FAD-dependent oxidoreductase [Mycobacterium lentiflavum]